MTVACLKSFGKIPVVIDELKILVNGIARNWELDFMRVVGINLSFLSFRDSIAFMVSGGWIVGTTIESGKLPRKYDRGFLGGFGRFLSRDGPILV